MNKIEIISKYGIKGEMKSAISTLSNYPFAFGVEVQGNVQMISIDVNGIQCEIFFRNFKFVYCKAVNARKFEDEILLTRADAKFDVVMHSINEFLFNAYEKMRYEVNIENHGVQQIFARDQHTFSMIGYIRSLFAKGNFTDMMANGKI